MRPQSFSAEGAMQTKVQGRERSGLWDKQDDFRVQLVDSRKDRSEGAQNTQQGFCLRAKRSLGRGRIWRGKDFRISGLKWDPGSWEQENSGPSNRQGECSQKESRKERCRWERRLRMREVREGPVEEPIRGLTYVTTKLSGHLCALSPPRPSSQREGHRTLLLFKYVIP